MGRGSGGGVRVRGSSARVSSSAVGIAYRSIEAHRYHHQPLQAWLRVRVGHEVAQHTRESQPSDARQNLLLMQVQTWLRGVFYRSQVLRSLLAGSDATVAIGEVFHATGEVN